MTPIPEPSATEGPDVAQGAARLKRVLRPFLMFVALSFVSYSGWQLALRWQDSPSVRVEPAWLALSVVPLVIASLLQARAWIFVIERLAGHPVPRGKALALYLDSQLARYAGKLGLPLVRMAGAASIRTTASLVGASIALEMLSWLAVGGAVGFGISWALGSLERLSTLHHWLTSLAFGGSLVLLLGLCLAPARRYPKAAQRFLKGKPELALVSAHTPANQVFYWISWALHGALLASALGASPAVALQASGLFPLATVAGFVVLVTPGGLGMREAVLALGLAPVLGASAALAASILSRAASLLAEVVIWACVRLAVGRERAQ